MNVAGTVPMASVELDGIHVWGEHLDVDRSAGVFEESSFAGFQEVSTGPLPSSAGHDVQLDDLAVVERDDLVCLRLGPVAENASGEADHAPIVLLSHEDTSGVATSLREHPIKADPPVPVDAHDAAERVHPGEFVTERIHQALEVRSILWQVPANHRFEDRAFGRCRPTMGIGRVYRLRNDARDLRR